MVLLFHCESSHACQSLVPLVETKTKKINSFKIIFGFFFTLPQLLATKVAISFADYSPKTIKWTQKPKIEKKFTGIERASEYHSPRHIYNSSLRMRAIHELKSMRKVISRKFLYGINFYKEKSFFLVIRHFLQYNENIPIFSRKLWFT